LIYIERLMVMTGFPVDHMNWRRITLISLILASKAWDDESFENSNFAEVFPAFPLADINKMERVFLDFTQYRLFITPADYAKYYFILKTYSERRNLKFPHAPMDDSFIKALIQRSDKTRTKMKRRGHQTKFNKTL